MNTYQPGSNIAKFQFAFLCAILSLPFFTQTQTIAQIPAPLFDDVDIGLDQLRANVPTLTEGVGVKAHIVESYSPNQTENYAPNSSLFPGTSFDYPGFNGSLAEINGSQLENDSHATNSARNLLGVARDLGTSGSPSVSAYAATGTNMPTDNTPTIDWINGIVRNGGRDPDVSAFNSMTVSTHSYILTSDPNGIFPDIMQRLDYIINESDTTAVVGTSNSGSLPLLWAPAYNVITVGLSNGLHGSGLTTTNGSGRLAIDVVVLPPNPSTSLATPVVAGAVAILQDASNGSAASYSEVIRATIMAGATKDAGDITGTWSRTPTQPLDLVYGAGELNILNSYNIQQGGEVNGGATSATAAVAGFNGWDYENALVSNDERFYEFTVAAGEEVENFSIALAWNLEVVDGNGSRFAFSAQANELANLSLELTDVSDNSTVDLSDSNVDNVEHIFLPVLPSGTYQLRVANGSTNVDTDYGLAFGGTVVAAVLLGDCNLDGVVDFFDIAPLIGFLTSGEYLEQADCNEDGVVDFFDIAPFIGFVTNN